MSELETLQQSEVGKKPPIPEWLVPFVFLYHTIVAIFIFAVIAFAAVLISYIIKVLGRYQIDGGIIIGLQVVEYALFTIDAVLFLVYMLRKAWRIIGEL